MLRFLGMRILASIPVLVIMSIITFAIIQAPPGDYGDYIRTHDDHPGPRDQRGGRCAPPSSTASSTASTTRCTCSICAGSGAW